MMSKFLIVAVQACAAAVPDSTKLESFKQWMVEHGKVYDSDEVFGKRFDIFADNLIKIDAINAADRGWTAGVNKFSDLTWDEFRYFYLMKSGQTCSATSINGPEFVSKVEAPPAFFDWREYGAVTRVKDQGQCGSCWTFSTTGNVEAGSMIHAGEHHLLSEQQLVDCAQDFNNNGCDGGLPSQAFEYIAAAPGLMTEKDYPYTAKDGKCVFDASKAVAHVLQSVNLTVGDEEEMQAAMLGYQPISIAFEVVDDFMHYKKGTYSSTTCKNGPQDVNHAVLATGYGTDRNGTDYWIVKNSWGYDWGFHGYFHIERGVNMCGLAECTSFALIKPPGDDLE